MLATQRCCSLAKGILYFCIHMPVRHQSDNKPIQLFLSPFKHLRIYAKSLYERHVDLLFQDRFGQHLGICRKGRNRNSSVFPVALQDEVNLAIQWFLDIQQGRYVLVCIRIDDVGTGQFATQFLNEGSRIPCFDGNPFRRPGNANGDAGPTARLVGNSIPIQYGVVAVQKRFPVDNRNMFRIPDPMCIEPVVAAGIVDNRFEARSSVRVVSERLRNPHGGPARICGSSSGLLMT